MVLVLELAVLVGLIEQDTDLNVVVFDSANPDFYLAHYDVENDPGRTAALPLGPTGMNAGLDLLVRLSRAPVVSIASIRGRARGSGSEFVLACPGPARGLQTDPGAAADHDDSLPGKFWRAGG